MKTDNHQTINLEEIPITELLEVAGRRMHKIAIKAQIADAATSAEALRILSAKIAETRIAYETIVAADWMERFPEFPEETPNEAD